MYTNMGGGGERNIFSPGPEPAVGGPVWGPAFGQKAVHLGFMVGQIGSGTGFSHCIYCNFPVSVFRPLMPSSTNKTKNLE
jgi:hypothetical protein